MVVNESKCFVVLLTVIPIHEHVHTVVLYSMYVKLYIELHDRKSPHFRFLFSCLDASLHILFWR